MMAVDRLMQERARQQKPVRVALVGAGATGRMIALHLTTPVPGIRLAVVANRTLDRAAQALGQAGHRSPAVVADESELDERVERGETVVTHDALIACRAASIDVVLEVTGTVEFAAQVTTEAIRHRKHVVLVNAELDSLLGPILKAHADRAGVVLTNTDGDEPGVAMTLYRYLASLGLRPVAAGNLKGMIDPYRTPETQQAFAQKYHQDARKVTSFADGTKLSMEATVLANATGLRVGKRGMFGPKCAHVNEMAGLLPADLMLNGGLVDYALGAAPHTGAFVIVHEDNPAKRQELGYYKMGEGPFYVFHTPYHLPCIQLASTIGRAALHSDPTVAPMGAPVTEVIAVAKRDLRAGEILDGVGGFHLYGVIENAAEARSLDLLPMSLSEGSCLAHDVAKDVPLAFSDVSLPAGRLCDRLWKEQVRRFFSA
jgi:predicted homoserine dehydrogenase-like protein